MSLKVEDWQFFGRSGLNHNIVEELGLQESLFLSLKHKTTSMLIVLVYRSPNSTNLNDLNLCKLIARLQRRKDTNLSILGDFSYQKVNWNLPSTSCATRSAKEFQKCIFENFLHQMVAVPTRYRLNNLPLLLDLIITNNEDLISPLNFSSPLGKSDHVLIEFQIKQIVNVVSCTPHHHFRKADFPGLRSYLRHNNWPVLDSVEPFAKYFTKTLLEAANT